MKKNPAVGVDEAFEILSKENWFSNFGMDEQAEAAMKLSAMSKTVAAWTSVSTLVKAVELIFGIGVETRKK